MITARAKAQNAWKSKLQNSYRKSGVNNYIIHTVSQGLKKITDLTYAINFKTVFFSIQNSLEHKFKLYQQDILPVDDKTLK